MCVILLCDMAEQIFHVGVKALVRDSEGRVLLVREMAHQETYWDVPGGRMEPGENLLDTLRRELHEEIGISDIQHAAQLATVVSNKQITTQHGSVALLLVVYTVSLSEGAVPVAAEDQLELEWQTPAQAAVVLADKYPATFCTHVAEL